MDYNTVGLEGVTVAAWLINCEIYLKYRDINPIYEQAAAILATF